MVKSDLEEIIEFYEIEKSNLEQMIGECIQEMDFKFARYHARGLRQINNKLRALKNLNDPFYDAKINLASKRSYYEKIIINEVF